MPEQVQPFNPDDGSAKDAGRYFKYMAEFVGFGENDIEAIKESRLVIEKHLPAIIAEFYVNLLRYPPTRKFFLKKDGTLDEEYLHLRMFHQSNFWRRTAAGVYDDDYARFLDYVGRAHTSLGADSRIYIAERYVIGMIGFVQHAVTTALFQELHEYDPELQARATTAWGKLTMVILEILARAYGHERESETFGKLLPVDPEAMFDLSVDAYEYSLSIRRSWATRPLKVGTVEEIPDGERKMVQVGDLSIGIFHHNGQWLALRNRCLHRGGPVAAGRLDGDTLICPWHGFAYRITDGRLLTDTHARLESYQVSIDDGEVYVHVPEEVGDSLRTLESEFETMLDANPPQTLAENEFRLSDLPPGGVLLVHLNGENVAVYNVDGKYYATHDECTHAGGPLSEGALEGNVVTCPWHGSCFDVTNGAVVCGPAKAPVETYQVTLDGEIGRVSL